MSLLWGIPYLFIRIAVMQVSPTTLVFTRTGTAALILLPFALHRGGLAAVLRRWPPLVAFAVIEIAVPWLLLANAERTISSSMSGLLVSTVPLVATVVAITRGDREGIRPMALGGLLLGLVGVAAIAGFDIRGPSLPAVVEMAGVVICYAVGPVILARFLGDLPGLNVMAATLALCAIGYTPVFLLQLPHAVPSVAALGSIAVLSVFCTALAFVVFSALVNEIGPVRATVITYVNPAVAAALGLSVLHEILTPAMILGFLLVLAGSGLATRRAPLPNTKQEPVVTSRTC